MYLAPNPASPHLDKYKRNSHTGAEGDGPGSFFVSFYQNMWKERSRKDPKFINRRMGRSTAACSCARELRGAKQSCMRHMHWSSECSVRWEKQRADWWTSYDAIDVKVKILPVNHVSCLQICRGKAGRGLSDFRGQWQPLEVAGGEVIMRLVWWEFKMPECGWWGHRRSLFRSVFCSEILSQCPQRQSHCSQANWGWREPDTEDVKWVLLQPTARRQHGALWGGAGSTAGRGRRALGVGRSLLICGYVLM